VFQFQQHCSLWYNTVLYFCQYVRYSSNHSLKSKPTPSGTIDKKFRYCTNPGIAHPANQFTTMLDLFGSPAKTMPANSCSLVQRTYFFPCRQSTLSDDPLTISGGCEMGKAGCYQPDKRIVFVFVREFCLRKRCTRTRTHTCTLSCAVGDGPFIHEVSFIDARLPGVHPLHSQPLRTYRNPPHHTCSPSPPSLAGPPCQKYAGRQKHAEDCTPLEEMVGSQGE
jgi:hypothetical protein